MMRVVLASNSTNPGGGYLDHLEDEILTHFGNCHRLCFIPYALHDLDRYAATAERRFADFGLKLSSVHRSSVPCDALAGADGVFVGGGNSFRLLDRAVRLGLMEPIRALVLGGTPYLGTSAGSNLACPTIMTTNDMPIVEPPTFRALGLVGFQINPHYVDRDPDIPHGGETRAQRIAEFHEEQSLPVIGLREGSWLVVAEQSIELRGTLSALIFRQRMPPTEVKPGPVPLPQPG